MFVSRTLVAARAMSTRRFPAMALSARRAYSEGDVARSREFNKKEKAHEDQYVHQHERKQMEKLRAEIEKKKAELADLENKEAEISKKP